MNSELGGPVFGGSKGECGDGGEERGKDEAVFDRDEGGDWGVNAVIVGDDAKIGPYTLVGGMWYVSKGEPADASSYWTVERENITMPSFNGRLVEVRAVPVGATNRGQVVAPFRVEYTE